jgi:hypothetical protein
MELPKEFFTLQSMLTLTGATGAVFVVSNGMQKAFDFNPKWLALAIAQVIVLAGAYFSGGKGIDYFVGVVNGFLVYCTAAGATVVAGGSNSAVARDGLVGTTTQAGAPQRGPKRRFLTSWF